MEEFLEKAKKEYFLKPGDKKLSPIIQASTKIGLDYIDSIINEDGSNILIREKTDFTYNILKSYKNYFWRCFCLKKK